MGSWLGGWGVFYLRECLRFGPVGGALVLFFVVCSYAYCCAAVAVVVGLVGGWMAWSAGGCVVWYV